MGNVIDTAIDITIATNLRNTGLLPEVYEGENEFTQKLYDDVRELCNSVGSGQEFQRQVASPPPKQLALSSDTRQVVREIYEGFDFDSMNVGVFGGPGCGKLSLINAILERPRGAAKSIADEDEMKFATQFAHPTVQNLRLWYLPDEFGEGEAPIRGYSEERCLFAFDVLLILESSKIRPADIYLAKEATTLDHFGRCVPTAFVRTKMDGTLVSHIGRVSDGTGWAVEKMRIAKNVRSILRKQLDEAGLSAQQVPLFLVSQGGIVDVTGKERSDDARYVIDEYQLFQFLVDKIRAERFHRQVITE